MPPTVHERVRPCGVKVLPSEPLFERATVEAQMSRLAAFLGLDYKETNQAPPPSVEMVRSRPRLTAPRPRVSRSDPGCLRSQEVLFSASPASVTGAPHENGREGVPVRRRREHHHFSHPSGVGASMSPRRRQRCSRTCALGSARTTHGSPAVASSCGRGLFHTSIGGQARLAGLLLANGLVPSASDLSADLPWAAAPPGGPTIGCEPAPAGAAAPSTRAPPVTTAQPPLPTAANAETRHARDEGHKRRRAKGRPKRMNGG